MGKARREAGLRGSGPEAEEKKLRATRAYSIRKWHMTNLETLPTRGTFGSVEVARKPLSSLQLLHRSVGVPAIQTLA
jgi:hypothetical protein